ncbi:MAG: two-component system response regulator [Gammaproteobacteria bacterium]|nr:MAG: two-component system response regulator [Gammaproteobacteria bacterium]
MTDRPQTVLVVDDTLENIDILTGILGPHYAIKVATNGALALKIVAKQQPDIILLDVMMPVMDGHEVCRHLKSDLKSANIPVIFITAMADAQDEQIGFDLGAVDYITKPIRPAIVLARVKSHLALADQKRECELMVNQRTRELAESQKDAVVMLAKAGHFNDPDTGSHIWRMAEYSAVLARAAQWPIEKAQLLKQAAPMHDTGKIGIPDSILKAPRALTDEEWVVMRSHTELGFGILAVSDSPLFKLAAEIALTHHEKWDGSGYPQNLKGEEIPESSRIVMIADVFDALTMKRPYKEAWPVEKAFDELQQCTGTHFEKRLVDLFISAHDEIVQLKQKWDEQEVT